MDALLERCGKTLTDAQWATLAGFGVSRSHRLPAYELEIWSRVVEYLAHEVYPLQAAPSAEYQLGRDFIDHYVETFVGRALFALLRLLGTKRIVQRLARSFRTGTNYTEIEIRDETETGCRLAFNVVEPRAKFTQGVLARGLEVAGIPGVTVELESLTGESPVYALTWHAK